MVLIKNTLLGKANLDSVVEEEEFSPTTKYVYLVFYPGDFTFVCPTEIFDLNSLAPEFENEGVSVYPISPDSPYVHQAWLKAPTTIRGLGGMVNIPLYSDCGEMFYNFFNSHEVRSDVLIDVETEEILYRRINPDDVGRDFNEVLRVVKSLNAMDGKERHYCTAALPDQPIPKE